MHNTAKRRRWVLIRGPQACGGISRERGSVEALPQIHSTSPGPATEWPPLDCLVVDVDALFADLEQVLTRMGRR